MKQDFVESICIFGSIARSSSDELSDKDVLIVADEFERRDLLARVWQSKGWNVSMYSPRRILKMKEVGSLFLQHIKLEGRMVVDRNDWLQHLLDSSKVKDSYREDAESSIKLALPIERFSSSDLLSNRLLVADISYVSIRNLGICRAADRGEFIFDYYDVVDSLRETCHLSDEETALMRSFREGKSAYRRFDTCDSVVGTIDEIKILLEKLFGCQKLSEIPIYAPIRDLGCGYSTLRDFEASLSRRFETIPNSINFPKAIGKILEAIRNPHKYSWEVRNLDAQKLNDLLSLKSFCENGELLKQASVLTG